MKKMKNEMRSEMTYLFGLSCCFLSSAWENVEIDNDV